jgi:hypothetical protein
MRRACTFLLTACAVLALASSAGDTAQAAPRAGGEHLRAPGPVDPPPPDHLVHLPVVAAGLEEGVWTTVVEEGFEAPPGDLWHFWDLNGVTGGDYTWARRDCQPYAGSYSAWAVGGGAGGALLPCGSNYPDGVDSWMAYGPFSLEDATAASLSFRLWLDVGTDIDDGFYICASPDGDIYACWLLTYQPTGWAPVPFPLDDNLTGVDLRGQNQVWIALKFVSDLSVNFPGGAYVDDVVIRKCAGGICPTAVSTGAQPSAARWREVQGVKIRLDRRLPAERQLPK